MAEENKGPVKCETCGQPMKEHTIKQLEECAANRN